MHVRVTDQLFLVRKPTGLATTWGKENNLLVSLEQDLPLEEQTIADFPHFVEAFHQIHTVLQIDASQCSIMRQTLLEQFSAPEEYGLLNRLDSATAGLVYFARDRSIYEQWRDRQKNGNVYKRYLAQVAGKIAQYAEQADEFVDYREDGALVTHFPLMHHRHDADRMVSCVNTDGKERMENRGRGKILEAVSTIFPISYDPETDSSLIRVLIHHGWRHQIRVHMATLGHPIVGDQLYGAGREGAILQLVSAGCKVG